MNSQADPPPPPRPSPLPPLPLRRINSLSASVPLPTKLSLPPKPLHHASSLPNGDVLSLELISLKSSSSSYTSLKDLLPPTAGSAAAVSSPTAGSAANSAYKISIRNRLVKQAAWAYLQPMSASPDASGDQFLRRIWVKFSAARSSISSCLRTIQSRIIYSLYWAIDRLLGIFRVNISR